jgi:ABC-type polar amino acid transport system ATPase subunit
MINPKVQEVIDTLREIEVDGETMQYILDKVGMSDQILRQLIFLAPKDQLEDLMDEVVAYQKIRGY